MDINTVAPGTGMNELAAEIHQNAVAHGWWEEPRGLPEILMLCVSELAEALEEFRDGMPMVYHKCKETLHEDDPQDRIADSSDADCGHCEECTDRVEKPEGVAVELADCIIRILDYCGHAGIDIERAIRIKHEYNKSRPYRHGGKKC
ncbi:MAG: hypothetical protein LBD02_00970 [Christensenellaceae bacterium]|jgi:NTP pyrophosphatase (non-canonical NTP hydrolase)|nr:hypothetical protein [Christensenellaceae bacterium]